MSITKSIAHIEVPNAYAVNWSIKTTKYGVEHIITYGKSQFTFLDSAAAAVEFGHSVRHALECAGKFDPPIEDDDERDPR